MANRPTRRGIKNVETHISAPQIVINTTKTVFDPSPLFRAQQTAKNPHASQELVDRARAILGAHAELKQAYWRLRYSRSEAAKVGLDGNVDRMIERVQELMVQVEEAVDQK